MKWLQAVERLALRAVAPRRAARRFRPAVTRAARSARAEWSQRDHSHRSLSSVFGLGNLAVDVGDDFVELLLAFENGVINVLHLGAQRAELRPLPGSISGIQESGAIAGAGRSDRPEIFVEGGFDFLPDAFLLPVFSTLRPGEVAGQGFVGFVQYQRSPSAVVCGG